MIFMLLLDHIIRGCIVYVICICFKQSVTFVKIKGSISGILHTDLLLMKLDLLKLFIMDLTDT